jgi:hypothetical protein
MMKPNTKIKLFLMLIAFLASFSLKNYSEIVDTVYGHDGSGSGILPDGILGGGSIGVAEEDESEKNPFLILLKKMRYQTDR